MAVPFGVFARQYILTWNHLLSPFSFEFRGARELNPKQKARAQFHALINAGGAAGISLILNPSRTTLFVIAGGTALVTFYAVTGYFKWCLTQPPALAQRRPPPEVPVQSELRIASPDSPHTKEDFRQEPDWLYPQPTLDPSPVDAARREKERAYFASLWKRMYRGDIAMTDHRALYSELRNIAITDHWALYMEEDRLLKNNTFEVEKGAPWGRLC